MFGRMYNEGAARWAWLLTFVGFNLAFFPQFIMGSHGMPRRYYNYLPEFQGYHQASTVGSFLLGIGFVFTLAVLVHGLYRGRHAAANPWGAGTLEWRTPSPPPHDNFAVAPTDIGDPYDYSGLQYDSKIDGYVARARA
jgi:cytochrome c oxidase subunit 1